MIIDWIQRNAHNFDPLNGLPEYDINICLKYKLLYL